MFEPKLGVSIQTISSGLRDEFFDALRASSIATAEISVGYFTGDDTSADRTALRQALQEAGIQAASIHALFGGVYDISVLEDEAHQLAIEHGCLAIALAAEFQAPLVIVHASAEPIEPDERSERLAQARRGLEALGGHASAVGTRIAVELLPRTCLGNTVEELLELLDGLDPKTFGVCLDTNHLMDRYESLADDIRTLGAALIATHLSDYDGIDEKHELPGRGVLDWAAVMQALGDIGYPGPFNYECKPVGETPRERIASLEENFAWLCSPGGEGR